MKKKKNKKKKIWLIVFILSIVIFIVAVVSIVLSFFSGREPLDKYYLTDASATTSAEDLLPENPIDFVKLHETNEDIYAWIKIPNTNIDHPILQSYKEDDNYYMTHDLNKNKSSAGAIYTQKWNRKDFSDPNTLIYGHHKPTPVMFTQLLHFTDKEFFDTNETFYIYTPGRILTYEIFAAYLYDDRHILNAFNFFQDEEVYARYLEESLNPKSMVRNVREGVTLTTQDRIITLSTCYTWGREKPTRYLVQGVLRNEERTK